MLAAAHAPQPELSQLHLGSVKCYPKNDLLQVPVTLPTMTG